MIMKRVKFYAFSIDTPTVHSDSVIPLISEDDYLLLNKSLIQQSEKLCIFECIHYINCGCPYAKKSITQSDCIYSVDSCSQHLLFSANKFIDYLGNIGKNNLDFIQYRLLNGKELRIFWNSIDSRYLPLEKIIPRKYQYTSEKNWSLLYGNSFEILKRIRENSVDMIFADPPYFLSNGGITCQSGKQVPVDKGDWDKIDSLEAKHKFNRTWIRLCKRIMKPGATIWISGTMHNIYSIGMALQQEGFSILNNITWKKTNPPPNLACRCFTHSTETILWACKTEDKSTHQFNYDLMRNENNGKQMKDVWEGPLTPPSEKKLGKHPTQKPLYLLNRIIDSSTQEGDLILDPFCGSSTTGVSAVAKNRRYVGIDMEEDYLILSSKRLLSISKTSQL